MFNRKANTYWLEFSVYQSYQSSEQLFQSVSSFIKEYDLSDSVEAVLNTLKLHSQTFFGVCWLKVAEIAKKTKLSVRTVQRVLKSLKDNGVISIIPQLNTKRGGSAPNVYVIKPVDNCCSGVPQDVPQVIPDVTPVESPQTAPDMGETTISPAHSNSDSNSNSNPDKEIKNVIRIPDSLDNQFYESKLKNIPQDFIDIMKPYYGGNPEIIAKRWKTTLAACKRGANGIEYVYWETIRDAWVTTVKDYKLGKVRDDSDHGLGGYYYAVLKDMAMADYIEYMRENHWK